jgi:hypothetical protein
MKFSPGEFFAFAFERGEVFECITCGEPHEVLQRQMTENVMARYVDEAPADPERSLLMAFVTESTLTIYRQWVADGKRVAPERLVDLAVGLVCKGACHAAGSSLR